MNPRRATHINGHKVEMYYWTGKMVVYIDDKKYDGSYEQAIEKCKEESAT